MLTTHSSSSTGSSLFTVCSSNSRASIAKAGGEAISGATLSNLFFSHWFIAEYLSNNLDVLNSPAHVGLVYSPLKYLFSRSYFTLSTQATQLSKSLLKNSLRRGPRGLNYIFPIILSVKLLSMLSAKKRISGLLRKLPTLKRAVLEKALAWSLRSVIFTAQNTWKKNYLCLPRAKNAALQTSYEDTKTTIGPVGSVLSVRSKTSSNPSPAAVSLPLSTVFITKISISRSRPLLPISNPRQGSRAGIVYSRPDNSRVYYPAEPVKDASRFDRNWNPFPILLPQVLFQSKFSALKVVTHPEVISRSSLFFAGDLPFIGNSTPSPSLLLPPKYVVAPLGESRNSFAPLLNTRQNLSSESSRLIFRNIFYRFFFNKQTPIKAVTRYLWAPKDSLGKVVLPATTVLTLLFFRPYKDLFGDNTNKMGTFSSLLPASATSTAGNLVPSLGTLQKFFTRRISSMVNSSYFLGSAAVSSWTHSLFIRFLEFCTGKKVLVQTYSFVAQHVTTEFLFTYKKWIPRMGFYEKRLGHKFFFEESLHILHLGFTLRDAKLIASWLKSLIKRISFWKTRLIFRFIKYLFQNYFVHIFNKIKIQGLKIKLKGKISAAGNSRKRTILYRTGRTSHTTVGLRVVHEMQTVNTFTGVMGLQVWVFY